MTLPSLPVQKNFVFQRRADLVARFAFKYRESPVNMTGHAAYGEVWDFARTTKYQDIAMTWPNQGLGILQMKIPYTGTVLLPPECAYDIMLVDPLGLRLYYIEGILYESEGYATPAAQP